MSRSRKLPKICGPKANGQMYCKIDGEQCQLGSHRDIVAVRQRYNHLIADRFADRSDPRPPVDGLQIGELAVEYLTWARDRYKKGGKQTTTFSHLRFALTTYLLSLRAAERAVDFRPEHLFAIRQRLLDEAHAGRITGSTANKHLRAITGLFRFGAARGRVPASVFLGLNVVHPINSHDRVPMDRGAVPPAPEDHVQAVRETLSPAFQAQIDLMCWSACRPQEARLLRTSEVCQNDPCLSPEVHDAMFRDGREILVYRPTHYKTQHLGAFDRSRRRPRIILLLDDAQAVIRPWLDATDQGRYCFGADGAQPFSESMLKGRIRQACLRLGLPVWTPNRLRHLAATRIAGRYGAETARVVLGHTNLETTQIYIDPEKVPREDYSAVALQLAGLDRSGT